MPERKCGEAHGLEYYSLSHSSKASAEAAAVALRLTLMPLKIAAKVHAWTTDAGCLHLMATRPRIAPPESHSRQNMKYFRREETIHGTGMGDRPSVAIPPALDATHRSYPQHGYRSRGRAVAHEACAHHVFSECFP